MDPKTLNTIKTTTIVTYTICAVAVVSAHLFTKKIERDSLRLMDKINADAEKWLYDGFSPEAKQVLFGKQ